MASDYNTNSEMNGRSTAHRAAEAVGDVAGEFAGAVEAGAEQVEAALRPERSYSLNALIAAGLAGFVLGRIFGR
ncbi:MAG TPA: hypothetical protein VLA00_01055 [Xanthobacteraceae bacterium]|nr:hypothetical protein [Xanthobacteraceae bacterium]